MVRLILYDLHPPIITNQDEQHDSDTHSPHDLSIFLKNTWKAESERLIDEHLNVHRYLKNLGFCLGPHYTIPDYLVDNEVFAWHLIKRIRSNASRIYLQISERLRNKFTIAFRAISKFGCFFKFLSDELKKDKRICYTAIRSYSKCYEMLSDELKNDRDIIMRALKSKCKFELPEIYRNDKQVVLLYVKVQKLKIAYYHLPKEMLDDRDIALTACISSPSNVGYISDRLQNDFSFVKEVVRKNYFAFPEFPKSMRENRQLVLQLVGMNLPLFLIPNEFQKDEEIVQRRLENNFSDIKYAHHSLLTKEFFVSLLEKKLYLPNFLALVPDYIATDMEIIKKLLAIDPSSFRSLRLESKTREIVEYILSINDQLYHSIAFYLPVDLMNDRELVKRCIEKEGWTTDIPILYREDEEIFKMALIKGYGFLKDGLRFENFIAPKYLNNRQYMSELFKEFPELSTHSYYNKFLKQ